MKDKAKQRIFILEGKVLTKPAGYDHVFSFYSNPADSYPQDYFSEATILDFWSEEFYRLGDFFEKKRGKHPFCYRGVDLLWCYKSLLTEFAFQVRFHVEALKRLFKCFSNADFYIMNTSEILQYPSLSEMLKVNSLFPGLDRIHRLSALESKPQTKLAKTCFARRALLWPHFFRFGNFKKAKTVFFSDFRKCSDVISKVSDMAPVMYCISRAPREWLRAVRHNFMLFQAAFDHRRFGYEYAAKARVFEDRFENESFFSSLNVSGCALEQLLKREVMRLLRVNLPKLLFDIDQMHGFFSTANSLKSALVDEDATATKSAFCQVARTYGVASFVECHGVIGRQTSLFPHSADALCVWGKAQKNKTVAYGCRPDRVLVTGCSRYDRYGRLDECKVRSEICKTLKLKPELPIVLFAPPTLSINRGCWFFEDKMKKNIALALEALREFLKEAPSVQLVTKIHQGDQDRQLYFSWADQNRGLASIRVVEKFDPLLLAKGVDFLVVYASTYAMDGFALNKPVISIFDENDQWSAELRPFGIFLLPRNMQEMKLQMCELLEKKWARPVRWQEARRNCLNEGELEPAEIIASYLRDSAQYRRSDAERSCMSSEFVYSGSDIINNQR